MTKSNKTKKNKTKKNTTKKNTSQLVLIGPVGLKPFEEEFSKTITKGNLKKSNSKRKKEFVKE